MTFLNSLPAYKTAQNSMYAARNEIIPGAPKTQFDFDLNLPWFQYTSSERYVIGEASSDHGRIVVFSTTQHLQQLARAETILGDGTFKICPSLWRQVFIISSEVSYFFCKQ